MAHYMILTHNERGGYRRPKAKKNSYDGVVIKTKNNRRSEYYIR